MVGISVSLKKRGVVCPFCMESSEYSLVNKLDDPLICWFKAQDYMGQNHADNVDAPYAECQKSFSYVECEFYKSVPKL